MFFPNLTSLTWSYYLHLGLVPCCCYRVNRFRRRILAPTVRALCVTLCVTLTALLPVVTVGILYSHSAQKRSSWRVTDLLVADCNTFYSLIWQQLRPVTTKTKKKQQQRQHQRESVSSEVGGPRATLDIHGFVQIGTLPALFSNLTLFIL